MKLRRNSVVATILLIAFSLISSSIYLYTVHAFEIDQITTCTRIIDGDSFETIFGEIRLADIDCPEYWEEGYDEATNLLSSLIYQKQIFSCDA